MNIGIVTPGKICPGVNTCIHQIALREKHRHSKVWGIVEGWKGLNYGFMDEMLVVDGHSQPGNLLHTSMEPLNVKHAKRHVKNLDILYCIGDSRVMEDAKRLTTLRLRTNIIGITGFGFQSEVQEVSRYIKKAHTLAQSMHGVVFLEIAETSGELARYASMSEPLVDVVITPDSEEDYLFDVQHAYAMNGHCLVVVNRCSRYEHIVNALRMYNIDIEFIKPGQLVNVAEPCVYDNVTASRIARQAVDHSDNQMNFMCSASGPHIVSFAQNNSLSRI
ncbi:6-phosphofructokinase [Dishui Lake phycodnavirus 2]|nr:6-phosphofructokinase [Dishui Lake phycodnavirus 2]